MGGRRDAGGHPADRRGDGLDGAVGRLGVVGGLGVRGEDGLVVCVLDDLPPPDAALVVAGERQHRARGAGGLTEAGADVGRARAADPVDDADGPVGAGVAVGHQGGARLAPPQDVPQRGVVETRVVRVHLLAGEPEHRVDTTVLEQRDDPISRVGHDEITLCVPPPLHQGR